MTWCFKDEATVPTDALLVRVVDSGAVTPEFWPLEAVNTLLWAQIKGRIDHSYRNEQINFLRQLAITPDMHTYDVAWTAINELAARHRLTSYDAAYLELALRRELPLATLDEDLRRAAQKEKVELWGK
jgi:predicted nucleic acid-binding protein